MWKVHVVDLCKLILFKICRVVKISTQNLTRCQKSWFRIWQDEKMLIHNLTRRKIFNQNHAFYKKILFKIMLFTKIFLFKIVLFKTARKTQNLRNLRGKLNQNVIFCVQFFFKVFLFKKFFWFIIWRVVKVLIHNLTRCKIFISELCFLNHLFRFWLNYCQSGTQNNLLENDNDWCFFYECVVCVWLTFGTIFLVIAFFMAVGFLMGVMTISFALLIDLYNSLWISNNG